MTSTALPNDRDDVLFRAQYQPHRDHSLIVVIVQGLATVEEREPTDLPPVYSVVDTDLVDNLFAPEFLGSDGAEGTVSFAVLDYRVRIHSDRTVEIVLL